MQFLIPETEFDFLGFLLIDSSFFRNCSVPLQAEEAFENFVLEKDLPFSD